jgi:hypothetical protein
LSLVSDICLPAMLPVPGEEKKDNPRQEMMNGSGHVVSDSLSDRQSDRQSERQSVVTVRQQTVCMTRDCHTVSYDI